MLKQTQNNNMYMCMMDMAMAMPTLCYACDNAHVNPPCPDLGR